MATLRGPAQYWRKRDPRHTSPKRNGPHLLMERLPLVERAMKDLGATPGYRTEQADCSRCGQTTLTIRALWTGL
jgi:hypothetical protein